MLYIRDEITYDDLAAWRYRLDDDTDWWCNAGNTADDINLNLLGA